MMRAAGHLFARLVGALLATLLVAGTAAVVLLSSGPVALGPLRGELEAMLNPAGSRFRVALEDATLAWSSARGTLDLVALGVTVFDDQDRPMAAVPRLAVGLAGDRLWHGELAPRSLDLAGPALLLAWSADGGIELGVSGLGAAPAAADAGATGGAARLLEFVDALPSLRRIVLSEARVVLTDRDSGRRLEVGDARATLLRHGEATELMLDAVLTLEGEATDVSVRTVLGRPGAATGTVVRLAFSDVRPDHLAAQLPLPGMAALAGVALPVAGSITASIGADLMPRQIAFDIGAGHGTVAVERLPEPIAVSAGGARGTVTMDGPSVKLDDLFVQTEDGVAVQAEALAWWTDAGIGIRAEGDLGGLEIERLAAFWPPDAAAGARRWVLANVTAGRVDSGRFRVALEPGELDAERVPARAAEVEFTFSGVRARYWEALPPLTGGSGSARLDAERFRLEATGSVAGLDVRKGVVLVTGLQEPDQLGDIRVETAGPASGALALLDSPRLGYASAIGLVPARAGGDFVADLNFRLPLRDAVRFDDVALEARATLRDFAMPGLFEGMDASGGTLDVTADGDGMRVQGRLALAGVPAGVDWRYVFDEASVPWPSRYEVTARLDDAGRRALRLPPLTPLTGPADLRVELEEAADGRRRGRIEADLAAAALAVPEVGWSKPAGVAGRLATDLEAPAAGGLVLPAITLEGGGLAASGRLELAPGMAFNLLRLDRLSFAGNDLSLSVRPTRVGGFAVTAEARRLDLVPLLEPAPAPVPAPASAATKPPPDLDVQVAAAEVALPEGVRLTEASGRLARRGGEWDDIDVAGRLNGTAPVRVTGERLAAALLLTASSDDAGGVIDALDLADGVREGRLELQVTLPDDPDATVDGRLRIDRYRVVDAPVLTQILTLGSLTGIRDTLSGGGVQFTRMQGDFTVSDGVIAFEDARAVGPALGYVASGRIDRAGGRIDIRGTLVPAYTINSVLGEIPLIGNLLIGREGEGVFAISFRVVGPQDDPDINVNPLSALAPGFLRQIVDGLSGGGTGSGTGNGPPPREPAPPVR